MFCILISQPSCLLIILLSLLLLSSLWAEKMIIPQAILFAAFVCTASDLSLQLHANYAEGSVSRAL